MTTLSTQITDWQNFPTGVTPQGAWCDSCKRYNVRNSCATTIGIFGDKVLMILRNQNPEAGAWALPGGYVDWNETLAEAAMREFHEETGIQIESATLLGVYDDPHRDRDGRQNIDHAFVAAVPENALFKFDPNEVRDIRWFPLNQLPATIAFDHRQMISDYTTKYQISRDQ